LWGGGKAGKRGVVCSGGGKDSTGYVGGGRARTGGGVQGGRGEAVHRIGGKRKKKPENRKGRGGVLNMG